MKRLVLAGAKLKKLLSRMLGRFVLFTRESTEDGLLSAYINFLYFSI